jgi:hypothetical protein
MLRARVRMLETPPVPPIVPEGVFDAFGWCESDVLEWRCPEEGWDASTPIDGSDPARMVFVMRREVEVLPRELARLHAFGLGLDGEWALAPYAIDDATDELYARRIAPGEVLWLAADNLNAVYWGLHDWAHFHNHGPFIERAENELQCDFAALAWMWRNRDVIGITDAEWDGARADVERMIAARFEAEGRAWGRALPDIRALTLASRPSSRG